MSPMVYACSSRHDGGMTQPFDEGAGQQTGAGFDPARLRSLFEMRRCRDDRMIAGVCTGAARHLNIDPVVVRVVLVTLTFFGLAGPVLYGAAWLLVPEDDEEQSVAGKTFHLGENEEQIRVVGLIIAAIIAIVSASDLIGGGAFDTPFPYIGLAVLFCLWWFVIRPGQRSGRQQDEQPRGDLVEPAGSAAVTASDGSFPTGTGTSGAPAPGGWPSGEWPPGEWPPGEWPRQDPSAPSTGCRARRPRRRLARHDRGALTLVTLCAILVALGALWAYELSTGATQYPVFASLALALAVLGAGILAGAVVGNGRPLVPIALLVALALGTSLLLPNATIGLRSSAPASAAQVEDAYALGVGQLRVDLSQVSDPGRLDGRTIRVREGIGSTTVVVPSGMDVDVDASMRAGQIRVFGTVYNGNPSASVQYADPHDDGPDLTLELEQSLGDLEVVRR